MSKETKRIRNRVVRELTTLENSLKRKLLAFYNKYIKGSLVPIEQLKLRHNTILGKMIQDAVKEAYGKGQDLASVTIKEFDINQVIKDATEITTITTLMVNSFWRTAQKLLLRETEFKLTEEQQLEEKPMFDKNAAMVATASLVVFDTLNRSVMENSNGEVEFTTAHDSNVDPSLCAPKDGERYPANDVPLDSQPPLHRHCRCVLVPIGEER